MENQAALGSGDQFIELGALSFSTAGPRSGGVAKRSAPRDDNALFAPELAAQVVETFVFMETVFRRLENLSEMAGQARFFS
jgi:hypothetical protein